MDNSYRGEIGVILLWSGHAPNWQCRRSDDTGQLYWAEVATLTEEQKTWDPVTSGGEEYRIRKGDRIAQLVVAPVVLCDAVEVDQLGETERGGAGFGSTGK